MFENIDPEHGWVLRDGAFAVSKIINGLIEQSLTEAAPRTASVCTPHFSGPNSLLDISLTHFEQNPLVGFFTTIKETVWPTPPKECSEFLQRLAASGRPTRDLVACVIGLAVGSSVNYAQAVAQVVDFYLGADRAQERAALINVCKRDDAKSKELLKGYVREAMRLNPQFGGLFRVAVQDDVVPQGTGFQPLQVKKGDLLFAGFKNAHLNVSLPSPLLFPSSVSQ